MPLCIAAAASHKRKRERKVSQEAAKAGCRIHILSPSLNLDLLLWWDWRDNLGAGRISGRFSAVAMINSDGPSWNSAPTTSASATWFIRRSLEIKTVVLIPPRIRVLRQITNRHTRHLDKVITKNEQSRCTMPLTISKSATHTQPY